MRFRRQRDDGAREILEAAVAALLECQRDGTETVTVAGMLAVLRAVPRQRASPPQGARQKREAN